MFPWGYAEVRALGVADCFAEAGGHHLNLMDTYVASDLWNIATLSQAQNTSYLFMGLLSPRHAGVAAESGGSSGHYGATGRGGSRGAAGAPPELVIEENGRAETISARLVVGAEGRSSVVRSSARFPVQRDPEDMMIAGILLENVPAAEDTLQGIYNLRWAPGCCRSSGGRPRAHVSSVTTMRRKRAFRGPATCHDLLTAA